jgi:Domain of unknown function (DUF4268)
MTKLTLGRLERQQLREAWQDEARDFTPWLAQPENLKLVSEVIGIDLELVGTEKSVGPFFADILCKDAITGNAVLIENQLERTDHSHLGQLLTYAAGRDSVTMVWTARNFTEEHRAALDWLNRHTDEGINFFALEIELYRIGDSAAAPRLNVVCKPNEWSKRVSESPSNSGSDELTENNRLQLEYWVAFQEHVNTRGTFLRFAKPQPRHWLHASLGRAGFKLAAIASLYDQVRQTFDGHENRAEFNIDVFNAKAYMEALRQIPNLESSLSLPEALTWYSAEGVRACRLYLRRNCNLKDRSAWPERHEWLRTRLEALHRTFAPIVKDLQPAEAAIT